MDVSLVILAPAKARKSYAVRLPIVLGRGGEAKFRVSLDSISRQHCRFSVEDGVVCVTDLGSTNGTLVDGTRIEPHAATPVSSGTEVRIGAMTVRIEYTSAAVAAERDGDGDSDTVPLQMASAEVACETEREPGAEALPELEAVEPGEPTVTTAAVVQPVAVPAAAPAFPEVAEVPVADATPAFPDVEPAPPPAEGSFDFLGTSAAPPPAGDDKLEDFFKSIS